MDSEGYDYLICLSIENTEESTDNSPHRFLYLDRTKELSAADAHLQTFPSIIEFDWCAYDLNTQLVTEELNTFVKPARMASLTEAAQKRTGVKSSDCESAKPLAEIIAKVHLTHLNPLVEPIHFQVYYPEEQIVRICHIRRLGAGSSTSARMYAPRSQASRIFP